MKIYNTASIMEIFNLYNDIREKHGVNRSVIQAPADRTWTDTLTYQPAASIFYGLEYPVLDGMIEQASLKVNENPDLETQDCYKYFNEVYNICAKYIKENQDRNYFQKADLENLGHHKVFAMTLIANLCKHAIEDRMPYVYGDEEQITVKQNLLQYKNRIKQFVAGLLLREDIRSVNPQAQSQFMSCEAALVKIRTYEVHAIDEGIFIEQVVSDITQLERTIASLDDLLRKLLQVQDRSINSKTDFSDSFLYNSFSATEQADLLVLIKTKNDLEQIKQDVARIIDFYQQSKGDNTQDTFSFEQFLKLHAAYLVRGRVLVRDLHDQLNRLERNVNVFYVQESDDLAKITWDAIFIENASDPIKDGLKTLSVRLDERMRQSPYAYYIKSTDLKEDSNSWFEENKVKELAHSEEMISKLVAMIDQYQRAKASTNNPHRKELYGKHIVKLEELIQKIESELDAKEMEAQAIADNEGGFVFVNWNDIDKEYMEQLEQSRAYLIGRGDASAEKIALLTEQVAELKTENETQAVTIEALAVETQNLRNESQGLKKLKERHANTLRIGSLSAICSKANYKDIIALIGNEVEPIAENAQPLQQAIPLTINNENLKKLTDIIAKVDAAITLGKVVEQAYKNACALKKDSSFLFSHNKNGRAHASEVMNFWEKKLIKVLNTRIEQVLLTMINELTSATTLLGDENGAAIDLLIQGHWEAMLGVLEGNISDMLKDTVDDLIIHESYSSYKTHSFRSYLHWMHNEIHQPTEREEGMLVNSTRIVAELDKLHYDKKSLKAEEQAIRLQY